MCYTNDLAKVQYIEVHAKTTVRSGEADQLMLHVE